MLSFLHEPVRIWWLEPDTFTDWISSASPQMWGPKIFLIRKKNNINPLSPNNRAHYHISLNNSWGWLVLFSHQKEAIIWGKAVIKGRRLFQILPSKGVIIWGRRLIEGQLLFKEIRWILQINVHTFPLGISWENLIKDQITFGDHLLILITISLDYE